MMIIKIHAFLYLSYYTFREMLSCLRETLDHLMSTTDAPSVQEQFQKCFKVKRMTLDSLFCSVLYNCSVLVFSHVQCSKIEQLGLFILWPQSSEILANECNF